MKPLSAERMALLKAADLIERNGLCKGQFFAEHGGPNGGHLYCAQGAIMFSAGDEWHVAAYLLADYLGGAIQTWNDDPGRTKEQVVAGMRAAAVYDL